MNRICRREEHDGLLHRRRRADAVVAHGFLAQRGEAFRDWVFIAPLQLVEQGELVDALRLDAERVEHAAVELEGLAVETTTM